MRPDQRVVARLPVTKLWDESGTLPIERKRDVGHDRIADLLRSGPIRFVLADCGLPLEWIPADDCIRFWRTEVKPHLVEPEVAERGFVLKDWPGEYCYTATEWGEEDQNAVVLLVVHH